MKKALLIMLMVAGSAMAAPRFGFSIGIGAPAPIAVVQPPCPGPGYVWMDGYYGPSGVWVPGFWRAPAVNVVVGPRYVEPHYYGRDFDRHDFDHRAVVRGGDFRHEVRR
ncbi:MAG TPA: hypothetical protein VKU01_28065 [Bryobacteraceae bacterium]|nr:hypothetical protein [Bryobacteraceae bacterium]